MSESEQAFERVLDKIGQLMNTLKPMEQINKMMALEMTVNKDAQDFDYFEIFNLVVVKLIDFYQDPELDQLWRDYLLSEQDDQEAA